MKRGWVGCGQMGSSGVYDSIRLVEAARLTL